MPGKIVDVFVKVGDAVDEGTPLVVLEAMKMENELRAPKKGKVTVVAVVKGRHRPARPAAGGYRVESA